MIKRLRIKRADGTVFELPDPDAPKSEKPITTQLPKMRKDPTAEEYEIRVTGMPEKTSPAPVPAKPAALPTPGENVAIVPADMPDMMEDLDIVQEEIRDEVSDRIALITTGKIAVQSEAEMAGMLADEMATPIPIGSEAFNCRLIKWQKFKNLPYVGQKQSGVKYKRPADLHVMIFRNVEDTDDIRFAWCRSVLHPNSHYFSWRQALMKLKKANISPLSEKVLYQISPPSGQVKDDDGNMRFTVGKKYKVFIDGKPI